MKVNPNINYETLKGLISRANTNERLWIADEWLRGNNQISTPEYQYLRRFWRTQFKKYGLWKIVLRCGSVTHDYMTGNYTQLLRCCSESDWQHDYNGGCMWDMELTEV